MESDDLFRDIPDKISEPVPDEPAEIESDFGVEGSGNRLGNPSFDESTKPSAWRLRCSDHMVHVDPELALDGPNFLGCSDRGADGRGHPSISQRLGRLRDGHYKHVFTIHIRSQSTPGNRRVRLCLRQLVHQPGYSEWKKQIETDYLDVSTSEWKEYSVACDGGGGSWICEVYWYDEYVGDIRFDKADFRSFRQ